MGFWQFQRGAMGLNLSSSMGKLWNVRERQTASLDANQELNQAMRGLKLILVGLASPME